MNREKIDCPSCKGTGYGWDGPYSPRPPVCLQCDGTGDIEWCLDCNALVVEGRCKCPCECGDCDECDDTKTDKLRLWLVVGEDRGLGPSIESGHATQDEATGCCGSNCYVDYVDIPAERIDCLVSPKASSPNATAHVRAVASNVQQIVGNSELEVKHGHQD